MRPHSPVASTTAKQAGFTLVELSIVLVIIGLLVGGILGGQELIRAAELNSISSDANKYKVAVNAFRLKYNAMPGDMKNAFDYWGAAQGCTNAQTGTGCNGNGDGRMTWNSEGVRAWSHLAWAGIVPGTWALASTPVTTV